MMKLTYEMVLTDKHFQFKKITDYVHRAVESSGIKQGMVCVVTAHTTTGITVNEGLDCLESDMEDTLRRLIPDDYPYVHAHWLPTYGRTSANATGHLRSMLTGNNCMFPVDQGKIMLGAAQDVYLCEFDGPQERKIYIEVFGE